MRRSVLLTAAAAMFIVALVLGQPLIALALAVVAGAVLGFLFFNFPPASIYMGDAGSLFLGFLLAGVGLVSSSKAMMALVTHQSSSNFFGTSAWRCW